MTTICLQQNPAVQRQISTHRSIVVTVTSLRSFGKAALAESPRADPVQARCSGVQVSALDGTVLLRR